jgi:hypothetical protein
MRYLSIEQAQRRHSSRAASNSTPRNGAASMA